MTVRHGSLLRLVMYCIKGYAKKQNPYKTSMVQSLLVFICDSNYHALEYAAWSSQLTYLTRCFIMTEERLDVNKINWKKHNDIFLNLNNISKKTDMLEISLRGATMYSSPKYQNILLLKDNSFSKEEDIKKVIEHLNANLDFHSIGDLIGFTREYIVLNGFDFLNTVKQQTKNQEYDDISLGLEISNALMGLEVDTIPFVESIKEVTSIDNIKIHTSMIKKIVKYQEIVDKLVMSSLKLRSDLVSLYLVDDNLSQEDLNKIKKELTREGMILYLTTEVKYPANPYKIIHHKNGTKAVIFK
jgi:hypothetical protein